MCLVLSNPTIHIWPKKVSLPSCPWFVLMKLPLKCTYGHEKQGRRRKLRPFSLRNELFDSHQILIGFLTGSKTACTNTVIANYTGSTLQTVSSFSYV